MNAENRSSGLSFAQLSAILLARKWTIAIVIVATLCATYALTNSLPKVYTSSAELFIDFRSNDPISGRQFTAANDEAYMQTQVDMIRSEEVANRIIESTKLMSGDAVKKIIERDGDVKARSIVIEGIGKNLEVNMRRTSRVVEVKYSADSPARARDALNAAIQAYMDLVMRISLAPAKSRQEQYSSQLDSLRQELDKIQSSITEYQQKYGIVDADERLDTGSRQLNELTTRQSAAQSLRLEADARHRAIQALLKSGVPPMDIPEVAQQRGIPELRLRLSDLDRQTAEVMNIYGRNHPKYKIVTAEREMLMRRLERESEVALSAVLMEQRRFDTQTDAIAREVEEQQRKLLEMKKHRDVISSYQRQMESVRQVYTSAVQKYDELLMASTVNTPSLAVLRWADLPYTHSKPKLQTNLVMAFPVGFLLGLAIVFLTELTGRRLRHVDDLEKELNLSVLGRIGKQNQ